MTEHHDPLPETAAPAPAATEATNTEPAPAAALPAAKPKRRVGWTPRNVFLLVLVLLCVSGVANKGARPVDDAFITYRYAEHLLQGDGLVFNPGGPRVEGYTSIGQILLSLPFFIVGKNFVPFGTILLGLAAWSLLVALLWSFLRRQRPGEMDRPEWFFLLYLGLCPPAVVWAWSGMEVSTLALAWVAAWFFHLREYEKNALPKWSALITVAAGLLHPEGVLIGAVLGLSWFIPYDKARAKNGLIYAALVGGLFGGYWIARWAYFGYPMPNTFYDKVGVGGGLFASGLRYVWLGALANLVPFYLLYLVVRQWHEVKTFPRWLVLAFGAIAMLALYNVVIGGDYFAFQRFLLPAFPFTLLAVWELWHRRRVSAALEKEQEERENPTPPQPAAAAADLEEPPKRHPLLFAALVLIPLLIWAGYSPTSPSRAPNVLLKIQILQHKRLQAIVSDFAEVGKSLARQLPKSTRIATIPIGALGYFSDRTIIDITGLTDTHIAHLRMPTGLRNVGHEKFDYGYIFGLRPELIIQLPTLMPNSEIGVNMWMLQTALNPIQYRIYEQPALSSDYVLAWMPVKKERVRVLKKLKREQILVGVYGYLRRDLVGQPGFSKWQVLPEATRQRIANQMAQRAKTNQLPTLNLRSMGIDVNAIMGGATAGPAPLIPALAPLTPTPAPLIPAPAAPVPAPAQ